MNEMKAYRNAVEHGIVSASAIDKYLWDVERYLMRKYGTLRADIDTDPLKWYIRTGRASASWLRLLMAKTPYHVARVLHDGGTCDEAIARVTEYITRT